MKKIEKDNAFLIIYIKEQHYALPADQVGQIAPLPMFSPAEEYPAHVLGLIDWRGKVIPLIDLSQCLGRDPHQISSRDKIVILQWQNNCLAIVAEAVEDMCYYEEEIKELPLLQEQSMLPPIVKALIRHKGELIFLLELNLLMDKLVENITNQVKNKPQNWTIEEQKVLTERAFLLSQDFTYKENQDHEHVGVVVRISKELFWFNLNHVQEFLSQAEIVPIPCTPEHVMGVTNLRGQIITVFDLRPFLGLERKKNHQNKLVLIASTEFLGALHIDAIMDLVTIKKEELLPVPTALSTVASEYARGHIPFRNKFMATVLDIEGIFQREELVVYEEI
ncbi:hypothetical protein F9B85_02470 [Heliorestis acidaminivorans]|uniref:CheW-like domain-containing protein n=1 Tax=Heliorestis acidaminivorans TaxID=553427 RepID=A0A6I0EXN7_9FIRM|nr:chemotaxis protein CheW [Heliorestis acidaminivorans]KAB2954559.1 hypothetical protein F9B85_02470 [Heliorestis acidaminivorans]